MNSTKIFPLLKIEEGVTRCRTCGKILQQNKDDCFQIEYASLDGCRVSSYENGNGVKTFRLSEFCQYRKIFTLVCERCCIESFSGLEVFGYGDGKRLALTSASACLKNYDGLPGEENETYTVTMWDDNYINDDFSDTNEL